MNIHEEKLHNDYQFKVIKPEPGSFGILGIPIAYFGYAIIVLFLIAYFRMAAKAKKARQMFAAG